jgi:glycine cleavage system H lipoate-binding protein/TusA-related sulfurtransferase
MSMDIAGCDFPEDRSYEADGLVWARREPDGEAVLGITSIYATLAGRLASVRPRPVGSECAQGGVVAMIEGGKYFGPVRTPIAGVLVRTNDVIVRRPKTLSESPYGDGWVARVRPTRWPEESGALRSARESASAFRSQIATLRVRCFAAFPDHEMFEIGTECAAVLTKLSELIGRVGTGEVVHLVSDDPTAPIEMVRWSGETGHPLVDSRTEGNLFHFLVRKAP